MSIASNSGSTPSWGTMMTKPTWARSLPELDQGPVAGDATLVAQEGMTQRPVRARR
ncbi:MULTISPECIES: hypothetical protein [unclassified Streptomyces]|uniref:hypothetical protein n=1 Tax=unclassified Streptomyces TaxID=2593676 RepID=UPI000A61E758|nr:MULTISPECIES: hypothetical protein [unclassified Streptomyces]